MWAKQSFIVLLCTILLCACGTAESRGCPLPPKGFSGADLIGTWDAIDSLTDSTIIIGEDGQYKQTVHVKRTGFRYESDWQPWRIVYSDRGLPYLHLQDLMLCSAYYSMVECTEETAKAGGGTNWYDFCRNEWVYIRNEGVFMVLGVPRAFVIPPRGIMLVPFTKSSDGVTGPPYQLRGP